MLYRITKCHFVSAFFFLDDKYSADKNKTQTLNLRVKIEDYILNDYITRLYHIIIKHVFNKTNLLDKVVM